MSITQTQAFLVYISNLQLGEGLGRAHVYASKCLQEKPGSM